MSELLRELEEKLAPIFERCDSLDMANWPECARTLDQFYIPTRYPDSLPGITPGQAYGPADSDHALMCAETILVGCRDWLAKH